MYMSQGHQTYLQDFPENSAPPYQNFSTKLSMVECEVSVGRC